MKTNRYLSHHSAAALWDIPFLKEVVGGAIEAGETETTCTAGSLRPHRAKPSIHSTEMSLPPGAVVLRDGQYVSSPELLFLELAGELSMQRLILLGLQLCSHPPGKPERAITSKEKITKFLSKVRGHNGYKKASRAAKYIENSSASIMESLLFMTLTLPHTLGGYGLRGAVLNKEIELSGSASKQLGQYRCYADIYFKKAKIAVEYDSKMYHATEAQHSDDLLKASVLEGQGISVMSITTEQFYDRSTCKLSAYNLARRMGKRMSIRAKRFTEMQDSLRSLLPNAPAELITL